MVTHTDTLERIPRWVRESVQGRAFADVGGIGVNAGNERITLAVRSRAQSATMIDVRPKTYYEWDVFHQKCAEQGVTNYNSLDCIDINDPLLFEKVGMYDVVHCTGIMYHMPCPVWSMYNLTRIVKDILIVNTVIVPPRIETEHGSMEFSGNQALFLPGISERERRILRSYYLAKFGWSIDDTAPPIDLQKSATMPWFENGNFSCWPYWWLFTEDSFRGLVNLMGLTILDACLWENHALAFLARKVDSRAASPEGVAVPSVQPSSDGPLGRDTPEASRPDRELAATAGTLARRVKGLQDILASRVEGDEVKLLSAKKISEHIGTRKILKALYHRLAFALPFQCRQLYRKATGRPERGA